MLSGEVLRVMARPLVRGSLLWCGQQRCEEFITFNTNTIINFNNITSIIIFIHHYLHPKSQKQKRNQWSRWETKKKTEKETKHQNGKLRKRKQGARPLWHFLPETTVCNLSLQWSSSNDHLIFIFYHLREELLVFILNMPRIWQFTHDIKLLISSEE